MSLSPDSEKLIKQWLSALRSHAPSSLHDDPRYYLYQPQSLITSSEPQRFLLGTGEQLCATMLDAFRTIRQEVLFVTCFWADSASQATFAKALRGLSNRAVASGCLIRVRLGFSSYSLCQKLTQTSSLLGREWPPATWQKALGLPAAADLPGLDLTIRSIFVRPFSVMHSKFIICDRERMFLPSCNVSWEEWFEGCVELCGEVVGQALQFWEDFWARDESLPSLRPETPPPDLHLASSANRLLLVSEHVDLEPATQQSSVQASLLEVGTIPTIFLPSPHHRNPCFQPFPFFMSTPTPPPTPLNTFLLAAFGAAKRNIYIQTPNVTSPPVLDAIMSALRKGVNVQIMSNRRMQTVEQLLTAGRLTDWALDDLWRQYKKMNLVRLAGSSNDIQDPESGHADLGVLKISYFNPAAVRGDETDNTMRSRPVKSHIKLTIFDEEIVLLGSGNMDRASWYTSQELGMVFFSKYMADEVMNAVSRGLDGCVERIH